MAGIIEPGSRVACLSNPSGTPPLVGTIYTCTETVPNRGIAFCGACGGYTRVCFGLDLKEIPIGNDTDRFGRRLWYPSCCFAPIGPGEALPAEILAALDARPGDLKEFIPIRVTEPA
jgi:hypothetical protein